ncbi:MAG TPA: efflux RND transporter periplasmic adaptor subunit [Polyangiales bacterium]
MTLRLRLAVVLCVLAIVACVSWAMHVRAERARAPIAQLRFAAPGRIEPRGEERVVGPRRPGILAAVHVTENQAVKAGQILAEVEHQDLLAQLRAAQASVELERALRTQIVQGARIEERRRARAGLAEAEANLTYAKQSHARLKALHAHKAGAESELDRSTRELNAARARRDEAQQQVALAEAGARHVDLAVADAKIAIAQAQVAVIEAEIEKAIIRAPVDGTILSRLCKSGEAVGVEPPTPLFILADVSQLDVRVEVDELDVARIHRGDRIWVAADAHPGVRFTGTVTRVGTRVGGKSIRTYQPAERQDRKVLDAIVALDPGVFLPIGLRVDVFAD